MNALLCCLMLLAADDGEKTNRISVTQVERIGTARFQHGTTISELWFPANDRVVSAGSRKIRLWDAKAGALKNEVSTPQYSRSTFDDDRRVLVAERHVNGVSTQGFHVDDLVTGQRLGQWRHSEWTQSAALSPGSKFAVLGNLAHTVSIVDVQTGREIDRIAQLVSRSNRAGYPMVNLSPDGSLLAVLARPNHVSFYELAASGKVRRPLATIDNQSFHELIFSTAPDQVLLIGRRSSSLWDVRKAKRTRQWNEPDVNQVSDAVFAKQGRIVAELADGIVRVRDTQSGKELRNFRLRAHPRCFRIALSPDGAVLAAGGYQERVRLYDFATGKQIRVDAELETEGPVESVAISDDGDWIASAEYKGVVSLWDGNDDWKRTVVRDDDIKSKFTYDTSAGVNFLTFLPGKPRLLSGSGIYHNSVNLWDALTASRDMRFTGHAMPIVGVATSRNGEVIASTSRDGTLRIWDRNGKQLHQINGRGRSVSLSPDGSLVAVCLHRNGPIRGRNGIPEPSLPVPTVELWSTRSGKLVQSFGPVNGAPTIGYGFYSVTFSHDGRLVAAIANEGLSVWDVVAGKRIRTIPVPHPAADKTAPHAPNCGCAFSPKENIIAVPTAEGSIVFLDVDAKTGKPIAIAKGHDGPVNSVAWRSDGRYLVSGGNDSTIVLWQVGRP